jgi:hypothetical protein
MKKLSTALMFITLAAIVLFWCRFSMPMANAAAEFTSYSDSIGAILAAQANQYSLLQIHLILLSIILAAAAIWGYAGIKSHVEETILKKIDSIVPQRANEVIEKLGTEELARRVVEVQKQAIMKENFKQNFKEAFNEGIEEILGGSDE